jgi:hypothetical protein
MKNTAAVPPATSVTADKVISAYIKTRDLIAEKKRAYEAEVAEMVAMQDKRSKWLLTEIERLGAKGLMSNAGTCSVVYKDSATVSDRTAYLTWVRADWENRQAFLDSRANKTAVKALVEGGDVPPPGVNYTKVKDIQIRRK